ncbi:MAG: ABC transporter permease subunit [Acidilobaceae archaeon]
MSRESLLYPLRVALFLGALSVILYLSLSIFPIAFSVYVAFTDADAKNVAPGPRLAELEREREEIARALEDRQRVISAANRAAGLLGEARAELGKLKEEIESRRVTVDSLLEAKKGVDSKVLAAKDIVLSRETPLYLEPKVRDSLDSATRTLDYRVWSVVEAIALVKLVLDERDMERLRREVVPGVEEASAQLEEAERLLRAVEIDYQSFRASALAELERQIEELRLHFVGLQNFRKLFGDSRFPYSLLKTLLFVLTSVPLKIAFGVLLAWLFTSEALVGRRFMRALLLLPWALPVLLSVTTWRILFVPERGQLSSLTELAGVRVDIYVNEWHAFALYNLVEVWLAYPFVMTVTIAAIAGIPKELLEAAKVDGASAVRTFRDVVLPLIRRPLAFAAVLTSGASLQAFMIPLLINEGGPAKLVNVPGLREVTAYANEMMVLYGYNRAWREQDYGLSAAAFLVVVLILLLYALAWYYLVYKRGGRVA